MKRRSIILAAIIIIAAMLACNLPSNISTDQTQQNPDAILTAAALTVQAQLAANNTPTLPPADTATLAPANTPTSASAPTPTFTLAPLPATATSDCDDAQFIVDVSYPDNTPVPAGTVFNKIWRLKNIGACTWTPSYAIVFLSGEQMGGPSVQALTTNVNPGQTYDVSIALTAPSTAGIHTGYWILRNASGATFHTNFYAQIKVTTGGGGSGLFQVTGVNFAHSGGCGSFSVTANITVNKAGSVTGYWQRNDASLPDNFSTLVFPSAGTQSTSISWATTASGTHSFYLYIDSPNHQQFGPTAQTTFTCP